ncbi:MAG: hypothetical protein H0V34_11935 [Gammaproteobacteria bacterium]|nr:hypothetical protein [Gammaproteobacteria bacterium]
MIVATSVLLITASAGAADDAHDYPTHEVVEYVFDCMQQNGGENLDNLYKCSCSMDYIAAKMTHDEFVTADTFLRGQSATGERAGILREGPVAESSRDNYESILSAAAKSCYLPDPAEEEDD